MTQNGSVSQINLKKKPYYLGKLTCHGSGKVYEVKFRSFKNKILEIFKNGLIA